MPRFADYPAPVYLFKIHPKRVRQKEFSGGLVVEREIIR
jgi:hypothetical protein